jgi:hypothetical protein
VSRAAFGLVRRFDEQLREAALRVVRPEEQRQLALCAKGEPTRPKALDRDARLGDPLGRDRRRRPEAKLRAALPE